MNKKANRGAQAEAALSESEKRYRSLFDRVEDGVYRSTHAGKFVQINPAMVKMFGYASKEEMLEMDIKKDLYFAPGERGTHKIDSGLGEIDVYRLRRKDGSEIWVEDRGTYVYDEHGEITFHEGIMRDVTGRVRAEEELRKSEESFSGLFNTVTESIYIQNSDGVFLNINEGVIKMYGYTREELLGKTPEFLAAPGKNNLASIFGLVQRVFTTGEAQAFEFWGQRKNGEVFPKDCISNKGKYFGMDVIITIARDVSERKQAETERQTLLEIMQGLVVTKDLHDFLSLVHQSIANVITAENFFVVLFNKETGFFEEVYSVDKFDSPGPPSRLEKSTCAYVFHSEQPQLVNQARFNELVALGKVELVGASSPSWLGVPLKTSGKETATHSETIGVMVVQDYDKPDCYSERDMDFLASIAGQVALAVERKQAEESLRKNEAMLNRVQMVTHMGSWEIDLTTKTVIGSDEAHRIYGIDQGSMTLALVQSVPLPEFRPILDAALAALIKEGKRYDVEFKIQRRSDKAIRDIHSIAEYSAASQTIIGAVQDITERKQAEDSIQQRVMELETINRISLVLRSVSKQTDMLNIVLDEALTILNTAHGSVQLYNKSTDKLEKVITRGWTAQVNEPAQNRNEGIAGKVFISGEIYLSREFASDPETRSAARKQIPPGWGGICLPIQTTQQTLGVLIVSVPNERELDTNEIRLLSILSEMTGSALQRMQLYEETARRAKEFASLYETSNAISAENELNTLLESIVNSAQILLNAASSGMYLYLAQSEELVLTLDTASYLAIGTRLQKGEGVAGCVAQTRQPLRIDDYSTWEGRSPQYIENFIHAVLEVPMLYGGELIGVLAVDETGDSVRKYSEADEHLLSLFASQAAGAIHSSRLHAETVQHLEHLQALRAVDQAISSSHDLRLTLNILLTQTIAQLDVDAADVLLIHPETNILELAAGRGFHTLLFESINLNDSLAGYAIREHRSILTIHIEDAALSENPEFGNLWIEEGFNCYWCVPLIVKGEVKGVLEVYRRTAFTPNAEWLDFLEALAGQAAITINSTQLFENLQQSNLELSLAYDATIEGWSRAMDLRDHETEGHTQRVAVMSTRLAKALGLSEEEIVTIRRGALLHDIGKMGIPDGILLKPGVLTDEEWLIMRKHPAYAYEMLSPIPYLRSSLDIPYSHHEKWDGSGYPQKLFGQEIPLAARIFAIVDVWDALSSDRPYRPAWSHERTLEYIREQTGKHFDPDIVAEFMEMMQKLP